VQLLQLQHAHAHPELRVTSTLGALRVAADSGLIDQGDAAVLTEAWQLASRVRNATVLWRGARRMPSPRTSANSTAWPGSWGTRRVPPVTWTTTTRG
jgi:[glutamine synthetase] adenylyltransferase / [glutamine synthetase]-adenylyl-L-tyrosine phosphorylase